MKLSDLLNWGSIALAVIVLMYIFRKPLRERAKKWFGSSKTPKPPQSPWANKEIGEGVEWNSHGSYMLMIAISIFFLYFGVTSENKLTAWALSLLGIIISIVTAYGVIIIPNQPPHFGIVTRWGKRVWKINSEGKPCPVYMEEGYHFLPWRGIKYNVIVINLSKQEIDFPTQVLTTPDNGTTEVPGSLAYTPDKKHIIGFLDLGTDNPFNVFKDMMCDIWEDELRTWARTTEKGPKTLTELLNSGDEAVEVLLEAICGDVDIPTDSQKAIRSGYGKWPVNHFGIILNRLNLKDMRPFGEVYESLVKLDKEKKERDSETYEVETDLRKAAKLKEEIEKLGKNTSIEECMEKIMNWKITREANEQLSLTALAKSIAGAFKTS